MEWTEETIERLRSLWQEGHSTAEIGRRMSITKNAVVGKAHRLVLSARPSPIRKIIRSSDAGQALASRPSRSPPSSDAHGAVARIAAPIAPQPASWPVTPAGMPEQGVSDQDNRLPTNVMPLRAPRPAPVAMAAPIRVAASAGDGDDAPRRDPVLRSINEPAARRRSQSCCWPLGDPGTKQFRFCGGEPIPGKPYCVEHAQLAYVKLRDRRDTVA